MYLEKKKENQIYLHSTLNKMTYEKRKEHLKSGEEKEQMFSVCVNLKLRMFDPYIK